MAFTTVRIEGSIFTSDILERIAGGECKGQRPDDFGFRSGVRVKDEIANAWAGAQSHWHLFKRKLDRKTPDDPYRTSETRKSWVLPLLALLEFDLQSYSQARRVNNQTYFISHSDEKCNAFPVHIVGCYDDLDKKRETSGPRLSPHGLVQEYLNLTEQHLYAVVTNGFSLRLLRDSTRLVRLSYIEFDLQAMMDEGHYADFALMFRLLHVTRFRVPGALQGGMETSLIEAYHQDSMESGTRIREGLSSAVKEAIEILAQGFLDHPQNKSLRSYDPAMCSSIANKLYHALLRLIYRLLFLMVIEERGFVFPSSTNDLERKRIARQRDIYETFYSVARLRKRCDIFRTGDDMHSNLWVSILHTFRIFEDIGIGIKLGIKPLAGTLFSSQAIGILSSSRLYNKHVLDALKKLSRFKHPELKNEIRINYAALNVEEFGSVYEGLLEYEPRIDLSFRFSLAKGTERSSSGSHYTPEELVQPLIRHSLDYVIDQKLTSVKPGQEQIDALLSITVCDATCGSGHILLSAARRIGFEIARLRTGEDQPSPSAIRSGIRDAITHCIYGVDKNPLAVELCKVALWLEAHIPGQPLNFLDHKIKCGDAIVGVAMRDELEAPIPNDAFNKMPGDDPDVVKAAARQNREDLKRSDLEKLPFEPLVHESMESIRDLFNRFNHMPEDTADQIVRKEAAYKELVSGSHWQRMKSLADLRIAQFFIPKTHDNEKLIVTHSDYRQFLKGFQNVSSQQVDAAQQESLSRRFFHWFLEFPHVFIKGGFDCIIGNPPYLGGSAISGNFGHYYLNFINYNYSPASGCDIVTYFLRRDFDLIKDNGFLSLITTNSISEGRMREGGLEVILTQNGTINYAIKSKKWPGVANLYISSFSVKKGAFNGQRKLDERQVQFINAYLDDTMDIGNPFNVNQNQNKMFKGVFFLGDGFLLTKEEKERLIALDPRNSQVIFPVLNGEDLNRKFDQTSDRYIINFFDWSEDQAQQYPEPYRMVKEKVKPVRDKQKRDVRREKWWRYAEHAPGLYKAISGLKRSFCTARITKYLSFSERQISTVFTDALCVYANDRYFAFSILQSTIHNEWARKYSGKLKMDLRYTSSDCFETFPFPQGMSEEMERRLEELGEKYHEHRRSVMHKLKIGLTKTYNLFHTKDLSVETIMKESEADEETAGSGYRDILHLRELHREMDMAVLLAYRWPDIFPRHDFYEMDYLPENDRTRFTISPDSRKEILKRLLKLNHDIHQNELNELPSPTPKTKKQPKSKPITEDQKPQKTLFSI